MKEKKIVYKDWIPRVSNIVEFVKPFSWTASDDFFKKWLHNKDIDYELYMKEASEWGSFIHSQIENYILGGQLVKKSKYINYINNWIKFITEKWIINSESEIYFLNQWKYPYQWTIDLVCEMEWYKRIIDFKTYWLAKDSFWLENRYKKPNNKLKKAQIQLSLYAYSLWIEKIWIVILTKEDYYFHELELLPKKEITKILKNYYLTNKLW